MRIALLVEDDRPHRIGRVVLSDVNLVAFIGGVAVGLGSVYVSLTRDVVKTGRVMYDRSY